MRTVSDLLGDYQHVIADVRLITGRAGVFDVVVDGQTLYSKAAEGRHARPGEVLERFRELVGPNVPVYGT